MSELGSAVAVTVATDVTQLSDDELRELLTSLPKAQASLQATWLRGVREAEKRQLAQDDGHRSVGAWLRAHTLCSGREGSSAAWQARRLAKLPLTLAAFEAGEIAESHVKQITFLAKDVAPETMAEGEAAIVEAARHADASEFRGLIDKLRDQWLPLQAAEYDEDAYDRRYVRVGEQFAGLVPIDGWVTPLLADKFQAVTNALSTPDSADVPHEARRNFGQRTHDALEEALSRLLDLGELPTVRREKPHVSVTVDAETLLAGTGTGETEWSGPIPVSYIEMLLCDATVHPLVLQMQKGVWEPVAILEDHDTASRRLWRYLRTRDQHCRFPGCDIPAVWCDAHHIRWTSNGGETSNTNCVLLCKYHHRIVHRPLRPWTIKGDPETDLKFIAPTGEIHPSPATGPPRCP